MVEDRGVEIAYGVFIQGEGGEEGTSVKGNPFGPPCFLSRWQGKTVCFHLKGGLARIFPVARGTLLRPGQFFTRGRAPTQRADVADHFIKLLYYSSGPCGDPSPLPPPQSSLFRGHFLPRHMSTRVSPSREFTARPRRFSLPLPLYFSSP